jgi:hypothetical protein
MRSLFRHALGWSILALSLSGVWACENQGGNGTDDTAQGQGPDENDDVYWSAASLVVVSPESGALIFLGEPGHFEAAVLDAEGQPTDFSDVTWKSDRDTGWSPVGLSFDDASLSVGSHDITAAAALPNGDRLAYTVGGVLVLSHYSGLYSGTISVTATLSYGGSEYPLSASGGATLSVDPTGETVTGTAACVLSLGGYADLPLDVVIDATNRDGDVQGRAAMSLMSFDFDTDIRGRVTRDGEMTLAFSDNVGGVFPIDGTIDAVRVSWYTGTDSGR